MFSSFSLPKASGPSKPFFYLKYSERMAQTLNELLITPNYEFYQVQFLRNFELVLKKHKKYLLPSFNIAYLEKCYFSTEKKTIKQRKSNEIYVFLCLLSKYEVDIGKMHAKFTTEDWIIFSSKVLLSDFEEAMFLNEYVFKQNFKNFHWTLQEDDLLQRTIMLLQRSCGKIKWTEVSCKFNKATFISQMRTPHQCKERWENTLKKQFKKGDWEPEEDRKILEFVLQYGSKWSLISKSILQERTEHNIKNRFFSLVSGFSGVPVKMAIKERKKYLDGEYVKQVLMFYFRGNEIKMEKAKMDEVQNEEEEFYRLQNTCQIYQYGQMAQNCICNNDHCFGLFINFIEETLSQ